MTVTQQVLGDYSLIKKLGQGSLGSVYLAEHRFMKKPFALKVLPEELSQDRGFIQRFEEEVTGLSSLDHPNLVKVHNISSSNGKYFLVTDCIVDSIGETTNLSQYLAHHSNPLSEEEILEILNQVAEGLDYIHSKMHRGKKMAHRGLKLNNILINQPPAGKVKVSLSDIGLSKIIGTGSLLSRTFKSVAEALEITPVESDLTLQQDRYPSPSPDSKKLSRLHTSFLQSFAFLAPEQKLSNLKEEEAYKADIFAFGVLVYYLIAKKFPEGCFTLPSQLSPSYRHPWDAVITRCLQQDPQARPEVLTPLLQDCQRQKTLSTPYPTPSKNTPAPLQQSSSLLSSNSSQPSQNLGPSPKNTTVPKPLLKPLIEEGEIQRPHYDPDPAASLVVDPTVKVYHPQPKRVEDVKPIPSEMVIIEGGHFPRGCNGGNRDEMPLHQVFLDSFAIEIHPVTNEQFTKFLEAMDGLKDANNQDIIRLRESRIKNLLGGFDIESGYSKHPVVGVTWYGAQAYAKWVGKRLPTEAEWEIAAKGTQKEGIYPQGNEIEKSQANFFSSDTTAVMSYQPNSIGLYDMVGNVYEWCQDWYGYNYYETAAQEPNNPTGPIQGVYRVLRGGCWKSLKEDLRLTHRNRNNPGTFNRTYGFRCAANVKKDS